MWCKELSSQNGWREGPKSSIILYVEFSDEIKISRGEKEEIRRKNEKEKKRNEKQIFKPARPLLKVWNQSHAFQKCRTAD